MDEFRTQFHWGEQIEMKTDVAASAHELGRIEDDDGMRNAAYDFRCTGETRCAGAYDQNVNSVSLRHWVRILARLTA